MLINENENEIDFFLGEFFQIAIFRQYIPVKAVFFDLS
jgi:hypothetical protein